jgi:predicted adenylyl cyclase CyaB
MGHLNIEIKARSHNNVLIKDILVDRGADFKGIDHQIDTYFKVNFGRLKLREGNIENYLIHYSRINQEGPKQSNVILYKTSVGDSLKQILTESLGVLAVVDKKREIYFIENVKFHLDNVLNLGSFVEIEAIDKNLDIGKPKLLEQCNFYMDLLGIFQEDLISCSYSDMLLGK